MVLASEGAGRLWLFLVLLFLYLPILVLAVMGLNDSVHYTLPFTFTTRWYEDLAGNERLLQASVNSVAVALANTLIATTLGTMAALAFARYRFRGRTALQLLLFPPITIPWLIIGTSMLVLFFWTRIGRGLHAMLLGHVALSLPYVIIVVGARLASIGPELGEAAASLGATPFQSLVRVQLPVMAPGIVAAALFAFAVSFDQFVISYFLAPPGVSVLPVEIFSANRKGFTPEVNAISTIMIVVSMTALLLFARLSKFGGER
ncbi:MAG: ABC transporter permease [Alphaproteobacteria bacterium]|nr:ABC transporter permease [Alphaproteobacteria bacterium]